LDWHQRSQPIVTRARIEAVETARKYAGSVLVVEDNLVNQKVAQRFLEKLGLSVTIAVDGAAGVAAYAADRFDLVLMDLQMPVMHGYAATQHIRKLELQQGTRVPIVALTADAMSQHLEMCRSVGMDDHLSKPIEIEQLRAVLDRYLPKAQSTTLQTADRVA
jgi:CheY-like chemotaxis protein